MGTASSVNLRGEEPLTFNAALKSTRLTNHEEAISVTIGSQDPDVLDALKDNLERLVTETGDESGVSMAQLAEIMNKNKNVQALLDKTSDEFTRLIQSLINSTGEKAKTITAAEVVGLLSAPPCKERAAGGCVQIVIDDDSPNSETSHKRDHGSLMSAASNYNQSTRIINYVIDGDSESPTTPRTVRGQQEKRSRKASLSIGIDLARIETEIQHKPALTADAAAIIIQKNYRGFLSRHPTPRPPNPPKE